jgi:predicted dehydrogenase
VIGAASRAQARPRLGFVGVGWIGQLRLRALVESGVAEVAAIADPSAELRSKALELAPAAQFGESLEDALDAKLDAVVIATPSALHASQTRSALEHGLAVFCQKPLGRTAHETRSVVEAARRADRLLAVDLCYRGTQGMRAVKRVVASAELGPIYHARLVFHNAYGPDKPWYYDLAKSGGGCVMDLGVHLVDLALWVLEFPRIERVEAALYAGGERLSPASERVEDFGSARLETDAGTTLDIVCSWNMPAGQDAVISAEFYGARGGIRFHNVNGSFYDFQVERLHKTRRDVLVSPPDAWGGRGVVEFARQLKSAGTFDTRAEELVKVAEVLDRIYGRS